jgi:superoxide dismutase, Fe-Mn family
LVYLTIPLDFPVSLVIVKSISPSGNPIPSDAWHTARAGPETQAWAAEAESPGRVFPERFSYHVSALGNKTAVLSMSQADKEHFMPYEVPALPYDYAALEPHIDEQTMRIHHDKHHQAYVDKVNAALEGTEWADAPVEDVLQSLERIPDDKRGAVRNNGGGHLNHTLFWESMGPDGGGAPAGDLAAAIDEAFGSFSDFQAKLKDAGVNQFGSGWAWLVRDGGGLAVVSTPNQDNPISAGKTPLLGVDVWEHAYYLRYQNRRPDYIDAWWNTVAWDKVAERFSAG